jgi:peptide/nickel transport system permease protein
LLAAGPRGPADARRRPARGGAAAQVARLVGARLVQAVATAIVLATICFAFVHALPGDLALRVAAAKLGDDRLTPQAVERIRREEGLDRPLAAQYLGWIGDLATGDLGRSLVSRRPVMDEIGRAARVTIGLGIAGWVLSYLIALPLGLWAGFRPGRSIDNATTAFAAALASLPAFLVGIGLIGVFSLTLRWLPPAGPGGAAHLVLPALTLALGLAAFSVRVIRHAVAEVRHALYMTFALIRGRSEWSAFRRHGVRNAAIPVVTFAALQLAYVFDGFVIIETLFVYPGLGNLLVSSLLARDVPMIMGAGLALGLSYAALNLVADLACLGLDPRLRQRTAR